MNPSWRIHPVFHVSLLEPYRSDGRVQPPPPPIEMEGVLEYEVDTILAHRFRGRRHPRASYLIAWKGYDQEHNSWEPERNVVNAPEVVADYGEDRQNDRRGLERLFCLVCSLEENYRMFLFFPRHRKGWLSLMAEV